MAGVTARASTTAPPGRQPGRAAPQQTHPAGLARGSPLALLRRCLLALALLVPLIVDPFAADTQGAKSLWVALCGCGLLAVGAWQVLGGSRRPARTTTGERVLCAMVAWSALSLLWARNPELGLSRVLLLLGLLGLAVGVREAATSAARVRGLLLALLVIGLLALALDAAAILRVRSRLAESAVKHASVLFVHNNMAAGFVTLLAPLAVAGALAARGARRTALWVGVLAALVAYLWLLGSRAGLLGAALAVPVVGLLFLLRPRLQGRARPGRVLLVLPAALLLGCALLPFSDTARGLAKDAFYRGVNLLSFDVQEVTFRPLLWRKTIEMAREHPLRGVGAGNFVVEFPRFERQAVPKPHAHNDALQQLAELGLVGLLLYLGLLGATGAALLSVLCSRCTPVAWVSAAGLFGTLAVFVVGGLFEVPFSLGATAAVLALCVGCAGALARLSSAATEAATVPAPAAPGAPERGQVAASAPRPRGAPGRAARPLAVLTLLLCAPALWMLVSRLPASWLLAEAERSAEAGDHAQARVLYSRVAAMRSGASVPERMLGLLSLQAGDGAEALRQFRRARALWPWNSELAEDEGDALTQLGEHAAAVTCYREAYEGSPARVGPFFKLVLALDRAGHGREAAQMLQYRIRTDRSTTMDSVLRLAEMWRRIAAESQGAAQVEALVASRHFYAVLLQEAAPARLPELGRTFKNLTHRLQLLPGSPASWWAVYDRFLDQNSLRMPYTALWTAMDGDGKRLMPGWVEPLGPPAPGIWRDPP